VLLGFRVFQTPGYQGVLSWKGRLVQVLMGLVVMVGGILLIAIST
jgi:hypothetical protein